MVKMMIRRWTFFLLLLTLMGCYQAEPTPIGPTTTPILLANARPPKTILVDGTGEGLAALRGVVRGFETFTPGYVVQVGSAAIRDGFKPFCEDRTDIQLSSGPISAEEAALCLRNGIHYNQMVLAYEALAIMGDAPLGGCVSATELTFLYTHDMSKLFWAEVRSGLSTVPVKVFASRAGTAAEQFFVERVQAGKRSATPGDIQELITVGAFGGGVGYLPLAEARKLGSRVTILAVDSGKGCTAPTDAAIWDGSYNLLSRPLYLYVNRQSVRRPEVFRLLSYAFSASGQNGMAEAGLIPAAPKGYQDAQEELDQDLRGAS